MKKRPPQPPKPKEFSVNPFSALKGLKGASPEAPAAKVPPPKAAAKVEPDDMALFFQAMAEVEPLGARQQKSLPLGPAPASPVKGVVRKIEESEQQLFLEAINGLKLDVRFDENITETPAPAKTSGSSRLKQLRRGTIKVDYELDLHGLTRDEALDALAMFVGGAFRRQQQAVLVITGKGNHSPQEPVLRKAVEEWLGDSGREMVAEFLRAPQQLGGAGAIVVFLKKVS